MNQFAYTMELQAKREVPAAPTNVMLEMSARCPQKCPMCPLQGSDERMARAEGLMDGVLFRRIVDQLAQAPPEVLRLHYSGESTVHPEFVALGNYARAKLPQTWLQMNSGGLLWTTDEKREAWLKIGIDKITFSIEANRFLQDGVDAQGHGWDTSIVREDVKTAYRRYAIHPYRAGAPWDVVIPNVLATARMLQRLKRAGGATVDRVHLAIQHMLTKEQPVFMKPVPGGIAPTSWEIEFSRAFWAEYDVDVQFVPVASIGGQVDNSDMRNRAFERKPMVHCREVWTNFVISWDGRVAPCCVDHDFSLLPEIDLRRMTLHEAWHNYALANLREQHGNGGGYPKECETCLKAL